MAEPDEPVALGLEEEELKDDDEAAEPELERDEAETEAEPELERESIDDEATEPIDAELAADAAEPEEFDSALAEVEVVALEELRPELAEAAEAEATALALDDAVLVSESHRDSKLDEYSRMFISMPLVGMVATQSGGLSASTALTRAWQSLVAHMSSYWAVVGSDVAYRKAYPVAAPQESSKDWDRMAARLEYAEVVCELVHDWLE